MDKVRFIEKVIDSDTEWQKNTIVSSLISCLPPAEACSFLDLEFLQNFDIRRLILKKISRDIENNIQPCHHHLVEQLMDVYEELPYNKKSSCGYCLDYLYDHFPAETQQNILDFFVKSKYIGIRRRAYKKLRRNWIGDYQSVLVDIWQRHQDLECASLIVQYFPMDYIQEQFSDLENVILKAPSWHLARLYVKVAAVDAGKLERLAKLDEITYAYVSAKLGYPFTEELALQIFERNRADERIGLLIWCFGQMNLWSVLADISEQAKEIEKERLAELLSRSRQIEKRETL